MSHSPPSRCSLGTPRTCPRWWHSTGRRHRGQPRRWALKAVDRAGLRSWTAAWLWPLPRPPPPAGQGRHRHSGESGLSPTQVHSAPSCPQNSLCCSRPESASDGKGLEAQRSPLSLLLVAAHLGASLLPAAAESLPRGPQGQPPAPPRPALAPSLPPRRLPGRSAFPRPRCPEQRRLSWRCRDSGPLSPTKDAVWSRSRGFGLPAPSERPSLPSRHAPHSRGWPGRQARTPQGGLSPSPPPLPLLAVAPLAVAGHHASPPGREQAHRLPPEGPGPRQRAPGVPHRHVCDS